MFYFHSNLQGSQTSPLTTSAPLSFYFHSNLQGSQTWPEHNPLPTKFYFHSNLQGSQTLKQWLCWLRLFYFHSNLQGSQTSNSNLMVITELNVLVYAVSLNGIYMFITHMSLSMIQVFSFCKTLCKVFSINIRFNLL